MVVRGTAARRFMAGTSVRALRAYLLYQHHHCHVTQPLLREQLLEWGIDLSVGQIDALLSDHNEPFFAEKDGLLAGWLWRSAPSSRSMIRGRGIKGKNGYVTQIGNDLFAWFCSTESKSRINFLQLLQAGERPAIASLCEALEYCARAGAAARRLLQAPGWRHPTAANSRRQRPGRNTSMTLGIATERHRRIATEGGLARRLAGRKGLSHRLGHRQRWCRTVCDSAAMPCAGFTPNALIHKLIPLNDQPSSGSGTGARRDSGISMPTSRPTNASPNPEAVTGSGACASTPCSLSGPPLRRSTRPSSACMPIKSALLLVLQRPDIPLHTNGSENDIRGYVKWRKISGGTRSDLGRRCRDSFASLKKTCRKLGISFWDYLTDRIGQHGAIPPLPEIVRERALAESAVP